MDIMPDPTNNGEQINDTRGLVPAPIAKHYETGGWKGDGPGTCGIECACGTTFGGFDTLAEASLQLIDHIADARAKDSIQNAASDDVNIARKPGFTEGLVEGYARGLGFKARLAADEIRDVPRICHYPATPICIIDSTNFCTSHQGVHPVDLTEVRELLNCPEWCVSEHAGDNPADPVENIMLHFTGEYFPGVEVFRTDVPQEGTIGTPALRVAVDLELTTWQQAAELARAILDGFGYLEGADKA